LGVDGDDRRVGRMNKIFTSRIWLSVFVFFAFLVTGMAGQAVQASLALEDVDRSIYLPGLQIRTYTGPEWSTVAANPQRTSWTAEEVAGNLNVVWYRPIEAYISQNTQVIASGGFLYISTASGLYVLSAENGNLVWRFDTDMPLGNSPTVANGVVYVGGYDRKLHALNAQNGAHLWSFDGANAGFDTNPLVIDSKVFLGNRDGYMYAIGAHGSSNQGQLIWKYQTGGPIHQAAAYLNGTIYFASNDNHAYALNATTGALVWKSEKMPGEGFHSYWPVIYQDKIVFAISLAYRGGKDPGTKSVNPDFASYNHMQAYDLFGDEPDDTLLGPEIAAQDWANGYPVIDASRVTEYLENNPQLDLRAHKPWRRIYIVLNLQDGSEYTFDSDQDGYEEYMPIPNWGTKTGNRYPPIVGKDSLLYVGTIYQPLGAQGRVMGWKIGTPYLKVGWGQGEIAEPQAISSGGNLIYRNLCCDRVGDYFNIMENRRGQTLWSYNLLSQAPGYDEMWTILPGWPRLHGWYRGKIDTVNSAYHNHGDQNPIVPYAGMLFVHRSNAIIAYGKTTPIGKLPLIEIQSVQNSVRPLMVADVQGRLEEEIQKIVDAGHLRPGYINLNPFVYGNLADLFDNPGDTLYTLSIAHPYLSPSLQRQTEDYLRREFREYFDPVMYGDIGWSDGVGREWAMIPPEVEAAFSKFEKNERQVGFSWFYPPHNVYAMWKYAEIFPQDALHIYELANSKLQVPVPTNIPIEDYFDQRPFEYNAYIAGYFGFLRLQEMAEKTVEHSARRTAVENELNRLLDLRARTFSKDSYWGKDDFRYAKVLDISRNFIFLVPELGEYLNTNIRQKVQEAVSEYEYIAPYWFVSRYESVIGEGVISPPYNYSSIFQAKAYILKESQEELAKYLDVPGFARGDLFYIQNLVAILNAGDVDISSTSQKDLFCQ
jgi:outer membrane protein assembly factor BamB